MISALRLIAAATAASALGAPAWAGNPFASQVISYTPGAGAAFGMTNPAAALGEPTRFTGGSIYPAVVSVFNAPWMPAELVSIGAGGQLTVRFDSPLIDDPDHPFGIDLLIFGNNWFVDASYPSGIVNGLFADNTGIVELSADGATWHAVPPGAVDGLFPTVGYLDAGPYDLAPGIEPSHFTRPVDPALTLSDFMGLGYDAVLDLYDGSGGGRGIDIGALGLAEVTFVRITNPAGSSSSIEIDGFAKVAPALATIVGDLNGDGAVDVFDLLMLLSAWGPCARSACPADLDGDGAVDVFDLLILLANWT
jgi:hypothetical protein